MLRLRLRTKLALALAAVLTPVLALEAFGFYEARERRLASVRRDLEQTVDVVSRLVDRSLDDGVELARAIAMTPTVRALDGPPVRALLRELAAGRSDVANIGVFDRAGREVAVAVPGARPVAIGDRAYFQTAMGENREVISDVTIGRIQLRPVVGAVAPIRDPASGEPIGVVTVSVRFDAEGNDFEDIAMRERQALFALDDDGRLVFHTHDAWPGRTLRDWSHLPAIRHAREIGAVVDERFVSPVYQDVRIAAVARTPKHGWIVGVTWPKATVLGPVDDAYRARMIWFGVIAALSLAGTLAASRLLTAPLRTLTRHARALARGELGQRAGIRTGDEVEELGQAVDQLADDLAEERRRRALFTQAVTHDMKNLLTPLTSAVWILRRQPGGPKEEKHLARIANQTRRLDRLISDLSDATLIEANRFSIERRPTDLVALAGAVVEENRAVSEREIVLRAPPSMAVLCDPDRVAQVLTNFVSNALKYDPSGAPIEIVLREQDGVARLSVTDRGPGLTPEQRASLFRPYRRLDEHAPVKGLGMGLFICKTIAEAHGGEISVASDGPGTGATFTLALPIDADPDPSPSAR